MTKRDPARANVRPRVPVDGSYRIDDRAAALASHLDALVHQAATAIALALLHGQDGVRQLGCAVRYTQAGVARGAADGHQRLAQLDRGVR